MSETTTTECIRCQAVETPDGMPHVIFYGDLLCHSCSHFDCAECDSTDISMDDVFEKNDNLVCEFCFHGLNN
jgi:hypothetical protein